MRKVKGGQRLLTALLCASLVFQHVSLTAFADETDTTVEQQTQEDIEEREETTEGIQEEPGLAESTEPHAELNSETEPRESSEESTSAKASETEVETSTQDETSMQSESATQQESDSEGETVPESETESESSTESETEETVSDTEAVSETETMTETEMEELKGSREGNPVSRIDWLRALTAAFELDVDSDLYPDNYYSDIDAGYTYYHDVMTATEYGLIDVEAGEELNPDDNATREFAAFTMNMCVGYVMEDKYTFSEEDTVSYPEAIQVAIDNGWLLLDGSDFNPNDALTEGDKDYMISVAEEICALRKIDAGHENTYELAEGVIEIPEGTQAEWSGEDELTITDCPKDISVGSIFVLFDCGIPLAYRAVSVKTSGNKTIISVSNIDNISDAFTSLDIEGVVSADLTVVSVNDTDNSAQLNYIVGGTAEEGWEDGVKYDSLEDLGGREVSAVEIVEEFELADYVDEDADLTAFGDIITDKFTFVRKVSNPKLNYRYANNTLYCTVTGDLSIFCSINVDLLNEMPSLDSISLNVTPLLCSMNLDAVINQTGAITCNYLGRFEVGLEYNPRTKCNAICRLDTIDKSTTTKVENTIGIRASVKVKLLVVKGTFYVEAGIKSGFDKRTSTKDGRTTECLHVYSYLYAKYGASVTIFLDDFWNKSWNYTKDVFTRNNSPIRVAYHYENGELVSQCSQYTRSDSLWGNGTNAWFYNTPANSRYGYGGGSTGYVDGEPYTIFEYTLNDTNEATITKYNGNVSSLQIPDELDGHTVVGIGNSVFKDNTQLRMVVIPESVTTIGWYAFEDCTSLKSAVISDSVTSIGSYVFSDCVNLTDVTLPNTINEITSQMFYNCTKLETINLPDTVTKIRSQAFTNSRLRSITLSDNVTDIESSAFKNCDALASVTLGSSIKTIGSEVFNDCDALTAATIPDSTTSIGQYIFAGCDSLKDVKLGTGLTKIPAYAFNLCPALEKIVLPYRITTVEANAFTNCTKLAEVTIPRGTSSISTSAFSYPEKLTIYGISGTYAETYANSIGATFVNKEVNATEVTLSETSLSVIKGATHRLVVSVTPENFTDEVVWKSSDTNVLTVDNAGTITAKAIGTATVRVAVGEKTASCTVEVVQPVTSISLSKSSISLDAFEEYKLTATVYPDNAADPSVEWTSSNEAVATVTQNGKVVPVSKGTATIKVSAKDGSGRYANCTVTVVSDGQLCSSANELESEHNYANNVNKVWKYTHEGAKTLDVTFDGQTNVDDGFDFIYLYDGSGNQIKKATGTELADQTVRITGDTVKIKLVSDEAVTAWGFRVSRISTEGTEPEEPESSTEESSEEESSTEKPSEEESSTEKSSEEESSTEESSEAESSTEEPDQDITDGLYISGLTDKTYTGSAIKQEIKVYYNKTLLQESKDYSVTYKNNKNAGTASITIKGKGNLTGSATRYFKILPRDISDTSVIIEDSVYSYDKKVHKKPPVVTYNGKSLKAGKDYVVTDYGQGDYMSIGTYPVKIKGIGNFGGSFEDAKVIIVDKSKNLSKAKVKAIPVQEYQNGAAVELSSDLIKVTLNKEELKKDSDYTVSYVNNRNPGKATLIIKGIGEYAGTKKVTFTIKRTPVAISQNMVMNLGQISVAEMVKGGATPEPVLKADGYTLIKDKDYKVTYQNHKKTGSTAVIVVKGIGNFKGSLKIPFTIVSKSINSPSLTIRVPDVPYTGKANKYQSKPIISDCDGNALTLNKDYKIESYRDDQGNILDKKSNPENGTTITITISGKGNYDGTTEISYKLHGMNFAAANIKLKAKPFTGHAVMIEESDIISANIKQNKITVPLVLGKDFEIVAYKNNVKKGTASVTFRGIGDYAGEKTVKFKINSASIK